MRKKKHNDFKIGEIVVYPKHGVGEIMSIESMKLSNIKSKFYVVKMEQAKLTIRVPIEKQYEVGLRKISSNSEIYFNLKSENKLSLRADNSDFNLLCLPTENFPNFADDFESSEIIIDKSKFLSLINKTKISISSDDTRHYLNGIFIHLTESQNKSYLTGVATDSHRLSSSSVEIEKGKKFSSLIFLSVITLTIFSLFKLDLS